MTADARTVVVFVVAGQAGDAPEGRKLLKALENKALKGVHVIIDKACDGNETQQLVFDLGIMPLIPPKVNCISVWTYDREMYKKPNEVEHLFRRLKGFRRIFSRLDKLDVIFRFSIHFALIVDKLIER